MFHNFLFINKIKKIFPLIKSGSRPTSSIIFGMGSRFEVLLCDCVHWNMESTKKQYRNYLQKRNNNKKNVIQNTKKIYRKMLTQPSFKSKIHEKKTCNTKATDGQLTQ